MKVLRPLAAASVLIALAGCSATGYRISDLAAEINGTLTTGQLRIAPGDTLHVSFPFKVEWNQSVRVQPDGRATFYLIDAVPVAGLTATEADARLTDLYAKRNIQNAEELTVDVLPGPDATGGGGAATTDSLFVVGEVERPGPIAVTGRPLTLVEAISAAGGHRKATANLRNTILVRRLGSGQMRSWRLDADIYGWGAEPPIWLQPRDIVFVPNTAIDDVNIWVDKYIRQMIPLPALIPTP